MANAELRNDFDKCTTLFKDFLAQDKINRIEQQIGAVGTDSGLKLSYIPKDQWHSLSQSEQAEVKAGRDAKRAHCLAEGRGGKGGGGGEKVKETKSKNKNFKFKDKCGFNKAVKKEVTCQVKALLQKPTAQDNDSDDNDPRRLIYLIVGDQ